MSLLERLVACTVASLVLVGGMVAVKDAQPASLERAVINNCHLPKSAAATCSFSGHPGGDGARPMTRTQLAMAIANARTEGYLGISLNDVRQAEGSCLWDRSTAFCLAEDLGESDLGSAVPGPYER